MDDTQKTDTQVKEDDTNANDGNSDMTTPPMDSHAPAAPVPDEGNVPVQHGSDANGTVDQSTDEVKQARETLKAALQVGLTVQMVSVVCAFAIKKGKEDFLKKLNDLILELHGTLSEEEKKELQEDTNAMMEQKAEELVTSLGEELSPEELEQVVGEIKSLAQNQ